LIQSVYQICVSNGNSAVNIKNCHQKVVHCAGSAGCRKCRCYRWRDRVASVWCELMWSSPNLWVWYCGIVLVTKWSRTLNKVGKYVRSGDGYFFIHGFWFL